MTSWSSSSRGVFFACLASIAWGLAPLYWKLLGYLPLAEVMVYRILVAAVFLGVIGLSGKERNLSALTRFLTSRRAWRLHGPTAFLLGAHWTLMVWGVQRGLLFEVTLGNYMIPLVILAGGAWVYRERLERSRWMALGLAAFGAVILSLGERGVPWLALSLAATFGGYVILRKRHRANSLESSQIDCLFLILPSLLIAGGQGALGVPTVLDFLLLIGGGLLTALPMLWQGRALKRLPLSRAGFYQYLSPTIQFVIAVSLSARAVTAREWIGFGLIWGGIAILLFSMSRQRQRALSPGGNAAPRGVRLAERKEPRPAGQGARMLS